MHCYGIQDIRKCSTASNPRKRSGKIRTERGSLEEGKSGVGREDILMRVEGWVAT